MEDSFLLEKIKTLPAKPGCYLFLNKKGQTIYVGKSKMLNTRVKSYFQKGHDHKTTKLVQEIDDVKIIMTYSEKEALILEYNLIKKLKPKFNIVLQDDKSYPYIIVTSEHDPRLDYVRQLPKKYLFAYGPLPEGSHAYQLLKVLQSLLPFKRCKIKKPGAEPCTFYLINQCSGACFKTVPQTFYQLQIKRLQQFFRHDESEIKQKLTTRIKKLSDLLQFEAAHKIKLLLDKLNWLQTPNLMKLHTTLNVDFIHFVFHNKNLFIVVLFFRNGKLIFKDQTVLACWSQNKINDVMHLFVQELYIYNLLPDYVILPSHYDWSHLSHLLGNHIKRSLTHQETEILQLAYDNAVIFEQQNRLLTQKSEQNTIILKWFQDNLSLGYLPFQIDIFDVSNWGMDFHVGVCCVYKNINPVKSEWRKYNLSDSVTHQQSDLLSTKQVIKKHYGSIIKYHPQSLSLPDIIIVDGSFSHVKVAQEALNSLQDQRLKNITLVGLVKNKKHQTEKLVFLPHQTIHFTKNTFIFRFLSNIQTAVDAFAKHAFAYKKSNYVQQNSLIKVKGISVTKSQLLFEKFKSLSQMYQTSFEDLNHIIRNKTTTKNLVLFLQAKCKNNLKK